MKKALTFNTNGALVVEENNQRFIGSLCESDKFTDPSVFLRLVPSQWQSYWTLCSLFCANLENPHFNFDAVDFFKLIATHLSKEERTLAAPVYAYYLAHCFVAFYDGTLSNPTDIELQKLQHFFYEKKVDKALFPLGTERQWFTPFLNSQLRLAHNIDKSRNIALPTWINPLIHSNPNSERQFFFIQKNPPEYVGFFLNPQLPYFIQICTSADLQLDPLFPQNIAANSISAKEQEDFFSLFPQHYKDLSGYIQFLQSVGQHKMQEIETHRPYKSFLFPDATTQSYVPQNLLLSQSKLFASLPQMQEGFAHFKSLSRFNSTQDTILQSLSVEQIDAAYLALLAFEKNKSFILGDETGLGKGRILATLARIFLESGKPVFFITERKTLFTDFWRDLISVYGIEQQSPPPPFLLHPEGKVFDHQGSLIHRALSEKKMQEALSSGLTPPLMFSTYSQFNRSVKKSAKWKFATHQIKGGLLILDESHVASGESNTKSNMLGLLEYPSRTIFSSATFAKTEEALELYQSALPFEKKDFKLFLSLLPQESDLSLAKTLSELLSVNGTFIRREHAPQQTQEAQLVHSHPLDKQHWDTQRSAFGKILELCFLLVKELDKIPEFSYLPDTRKSEKTSLWTLLGGFLARSARQFILLSKLEECILLTEKLIKENKKPIIALQSTFESFLAVLAEQPNQILSDLEDEHFSEQYIKSFHRLPQEKILFKNLLHQNILKMLPNVEQITHKYPQIDFIYRKYLHYLEQLPPFIASPMDYLRISLQERNLRSAEISGRNMLINKIDNNLWSIEPCAQMPREQMIKNFNDGELDVLFITQAGATGISLHASSDFKDTRQRAFIELEISANPALRLQFLGRARRKGQLSAPEHYILLSSEPYEKRILSRAQQRANKLSFLQNSTSSGQKSLPILQNYLTPWSNKLAVLWLTANPSIAEKMALNVHALQGQLEMLIGGPADRFFHRIILLTVQEQELALEFFEQASKSIEVANEPTRSNWTLIERKKAWGPLNTRTASMQDNNVYFEHWLSCGSFANAGVEHIEYYIKNSPMLDLKELSERINQETLQYIGRFGTNSYFQHQLLNLKQVVRYLKPLNKVIFFHPETFSYTQALLARIHPPSNKNFYPFASHWTVDLFIPNQKHVYSTSLHTLLDDASTEFLESKNDTISNFAFNKQGFFPKHKTTLSGHPIYARWFCIKTSDNPSAVAFESIYIGNNDTHLTLPYSSSSQEAQGIPLLNPMLCLKSLFADSQIALFNHKQSSLASIILRKVFKGWSLAFSSDAQAKYLSFALQKRLQRESTKDANWHSYFVAAKDLPAVLHNLYLQQITFYLPSSKQKWHEMALTELFLKK